MLGPFKEEILFVKKLQVKHFSKKKTLLFIDEHIKNFPEIQSLDYQFECVYLKAGESLKSIETLKQVLIDIQPQMEKLKPPYVFGAVGGGSLGDFVGFLSSIYHRGVSFVQCPSTWLAAVDSAHGGKTALNVLNFKNQLGSFYPAERIIISKSLLSHQSPQWALGEITKTILLSKPHSKLRTYFKNPKAIHQKQAWEILSDLIKVKNFYVKKDPQEKKKERFKLNLGHTVGHALEKIYGLSHSEAVLRGLLFTFNWSIRKKYLNTQVLETFLRFLKTNQVYLKPLEPQQKDEFEKALLKDKKRRGNNIHYVFFKNLKTVVQKVSVDEILGEIKVQGLIKL